MLTAFSKQQQQIVNFTAYALKIEQQNRQLHLQNSQAQFRLQQALSQNDKNLSQDKQILSSNTNSAEPSAVADLP